MSGDSANALSPNHNSMNINSCKLGYIDMAGSMDARKGQRSIRINDRWRVCFLWDNGNARDVEIVDYH